jgi:DNA-binding transcriptional LysR family regulator
MELRQLQYFLTLADELHFTRAAQRIPISQPQLSSQIKRLETELGVPLFNRSKRHVELTEAGRIFADEVQGILAQLNEAARMAASVSRGEAGILRIGYIEPVALAILPAHFLAFTAAVPSATIQPQELPTGHVVHGLEDGLLDIGYIRPMALAHIHTKVIAREEILLVLPASHPLADEHGIALDQLRGDLFIHPSTEGGGGWNQQIDALFRAAKMVPRQGAVADRPATLIALAASGYGYGMLPESCRKLAGSEVVLRRIAGQRAEISTAVAWRESNEKHPLVARYIDVVLSQAGHDFGDDAQASPDLGATSW